VIVLGFDCPSVVIADQNHAVIAQVPRNRGRHRSAAERRMAGEQRFVVLNELDDVVFAAVEQRWLARASLVGAAVAVAAAVTGPSVRPVRVQGAAADVAVDQPRQCVSTDGAVRRRRRGVGPLHGDEVSLAHQRRVAGFGGHDPDGALGSPRHVSVTIHPVIGLKSEVFTGLAVPYLPAGVARVRQDRSDGRQHPARPVPVRVPVRV
jgi:hypothetical protein